ncbi:endo-beta-N-acetylglucosaminidase [Romboutsia weinsteinii]|uniref:Endo-beta-N-acetylglucosaminidase n=1 Tax=Romboutsia weinsteinii TaxID=2020949 RepID=A0A371JAC4_9FIRM|nr:discoidin domain-containing protein [Romboutsia weinsteinii]RDY29712.1 endo-beta-N-acetylglucosaminidase [Romboutsia weinsteinii]
MNYKKYVSSALVAVLLFSSTLRGEALIDSDIATQEKTGQPFASYWYPNELLNWNPNNDKDAKFNVGTVELQERTDGEELKDSQDDDAKVISLAIANKTTSSTPSQGKDDFEGYNFSYWQYIDTLVAWGGSAAEGLILPPSADLIDAAHTNGVPVLGTVFFPPLEYGGKYEWMEEFLQKNPDGSFPMADKLLEVADYYNFDGWFINQETGGRGSEHVKPELAKLMKEFLKYLQDKKPKEMEVIWYDSMIDDGRVFWQNRLNEYNKNFLGDNKNKLSDGMFLNFWWTDEKYSIVDPENADKRIPYTVTGKELKESADLAKSMKRDPYDLYAGVDVQANGYNTKIKWDYLFPEGKDANTSLGLYCPSWTYDSSKTFEEFLEKENRFWVNESGDPRNESTENWKGVSNNFVEKSPVTSLPFVTNFSMGNGKFFNVDGKQVSSEKWNHRGMMDVLPTYRWVIDNKNNNLSADLDYTESYYGGNSISLQGKLVKGGNTNIKLYASEVDITNNSEISVMYKENGGNAKIKLELTFDEDDKKVLDLNTTKEGDWTKASTSLKQFKGKELTEISLIVDGQSNTDSYKLNLGQLAITDKNKGTKLSKISNLNVEDFKIVDNYYGNVRLTWDKAKGDISHYEIYKENIDGNRTLVGSTPSNAFYIKDIERNLELDSTTKFVVTPVSNVFDSSSKYEASVSVAWDKLEKPQANFEASSSIITPGEKITLSDKSVAGEKIKWIVEGSNEGELEGKTADFSFAKPGVYTIKQIVSNPAGETENIKEDAIVVSSQAEGGLVNLALNKEAKANAQVNDNEAAKFTVDGDIKSKWCAFGGEGNWIEIDLGKENILKELRISHAEAGGEARSLNTSDYTIEVSNDGENWREIQNIKGNVDAISKDDLKFELARYVRLKINKSEQGLGGATRLYEIEVLGLNTDKLTVLDNREALSKLKETVSNIEEEYKKLDFSNVDTNKVEEFNNNFDKVKSILDIVEVEKEEIEKAEKYVIGLFDELKQLITE